MSTTVAKTLRRVKDTAGHTTLARVGHTDNRWYLVDATNKTLGRLASAVAVRLMGKHKPIYTPTVDVGDYIVVINTSKIRVSGRKLAQRQYEYYTYYPGGRRIKPLRDMLQQHPDTVFRMAVRRMLPKTKMGEKMLGKLKCFREAQHEHAAQKPQPLELG